MSKTITTVKKHLTNCDPCGKCVQALELLENRAPSHGLSKVA